MENLFAKNIKYIRLKKKLSMNDFAEHISVNQSTLSRWENREMGITVDNVFEISKKINVSVIDLLVVDIEKEYKGEIPFDDRYNQKDLLDKRYSDNEEKLREMVIAIINEENEKENIND